MHDTPHTHRAAAAGLPRPRADTPARIKHFTIIARDLGLACGLSTAGPVLVQGRVRGGICCPSLEIEAQAHVAGAVEAEEAVIDGRVTGPVRAGRAWLGASASAGGDVIAKRLYLDQGAFVAGRTFPPARLTRGVLRHLARLAWKPRRADGIELLTLQALLLDRLAGECDGIVYVSMLGLHELGRHRSRSARVVPRLLGRGEGDPERALPRPRRAVEPPERLLSVIADDGKVESDIVTAGDVHIYGDVRGNVQCRICVIGDASRIEGSVIARKIVVDGRVSGSVSAEHVELNTTARVGGQVNFGDLDIRGGARYASALQIMPPPSGRHAPLNPGHQATQVIEACLGSMKAAA